MWKKFDESLGDVYKRQLYTSVSRSDWAAVVEGLIDILSEKLGDGKRIHINGLGRCV